MRRQSKARLTGWFASLGRSQCPTAAASLSRIRLVRQLNLAPSFTGKRPGALSYFERITGLFIHAGMISGIPHTSPAQVSLCVRSMISRSVVHACEPSVGVIGKGAVWQAERGGEPPSSSLTAMWRVPESPCHHPIKDLHPASVPCLSPLHRDVNMRHFPPAPAPCVTTGTLVCHQTSHGPGHEKTT